MKKNKKTKKKNSANKRTVKTTKKNAVVKAKDVQEYHHTFTNVLSEQVKELVTNPGPVTVTRVDDGGNEQLREQWRKEANLELQEIIDEKAQELSKRSFFKKFFDKLKQSFWD